MQSQLKGKTAVVTGGGTGMGRELCRALTKAGCQVASCDLLMDNLEETRDLCAAEPGAAALSIHKCDVASEADILAFRDQAQQALGGALNFLFNNAGIGGTVSITSEADRADWERTFNVCWYGVYYSCRAFMPMLMAAKAAHIVNTSSVNGFWASIGPSVPHSAYSAAKFAVKGFTEALVTDLRIHAPHIKASVVMPGHIGTSIAINSGKLMGHSEPLKMSAAEVKQLRERLMQAGGDTAEALMNLSDDQIREFLHQRGIAFRDQAPTSAAQAAQIILDAVLAGKWRILVGEDAENLDRQVRAAPEEAYEPEFLQTLIDKGEFGQAIIDAVAQ